MATNENKPNRLSSLLKNIFFLILILQFAPALITSVKKGIKKITNPDTYVGCISIKSISDSTSCIKQIHKFQKQSDVKALLLKINSPGGAPGASQAIFNELKKFKIEKPIVAMVEDLCASGGYYVASIADCIISNPGAIVGNIGAKWVLPNIKEFLNHYNIKVEEIQSGEYKTLLSMTKDRTPQETKLLQDFSNNVYKQFTTDVATQRKLDLAKKDIWANGRIFTGEQGLKLKLVDQLGSLSDAKETLAKLIADRNVEVKGKIKLIYPKTKSPLEKFLYGESNYNQNEGAIGVMVAAISKVWSQVLTNLSTQNILS